MNLSKNTTVTASNVMGTTKRFLLQAAVALLATAVVAPSADAALIVSNVVEDPGTIQSVRALHPDMNGNLMHGAKVTVVGTAGFAETVIWQGLGGVSGEANGPVLGWRLSLNGDSGGNPLVLEGLGTNGIQEFTIDLMPDHQIAVFDDLEPNPGTPGSVGGTDPWNGLIAAGSQSIHGWDIEVAYRDAVTMGGNPPAGDTYRNLHIKFTDPFISNDRLEYIADSDWVAVPEPASLALLSLGVLMLTCRARRR